MPDDSHTSAEDAKQQPNETPSLGAVATKLPVVPILGMLTIVLLAIWIGLNIRPSLKTPAMDHDPMAAMKAELSAADTELNALRISMGLRPKESAFEPIEDVAARIKKDAETMVALAESFQATLAEKEALLSAKNSQIIESENLRRILVKDLESLRLQLGNSLGAAGMTEQIKAENQALQSQIQSLEGQLASLRQQLEETPADLPEEEVTRWQQRLDEANRAREFLEARLEQMEQELSKARLFANSENELLPAAVELFRSLRKLENRTEAEISSEYAELGAKIGASVLHMLSFETGSSRLSSVDEDRIRTIAAEVPDGDLVLFVGYASETGKVDSNRTLSSDRATVAAEFFSSIKRPGQLVQAVYLGQTDRFSTQSPERNQLVEIWRIRAK